MDLSKITEILKRADGQINEMVESMLKPGYDGNSLAFKGRMINFLKDDQAFKNELYMIITEHFTNVKTFNGGEAFALKFNTETPPFSIGKTTGEVIDDIIVRDPNNNVPITAADSRLNDDNRGPNDKSEIKSVTTMVPESQKKNIDIGFNKKK